MHIEKIYKLGIFRFFLIYILAVILLSFVMGGFYLLYLYAFGDLGQWPEVVKKSIAVGFSTSNVEGIVKETPFSNLIFIVFVLHSIALLLVSMFLQGFITARIIKPKTKLLVSKHATFNPFYGVDGYQSPHVLFRLINAGSSELLSLTLKAYLVVRNKDNDGNVTSLFYFPISNMDPVDVPVIEPMLVWKIAVPVQSFSNSYAKNYELYPHLEQGSIKGDRSIELLVSGTESASSSSFIQTFSVMLEKDIVKTEDGFFCGDFESLPPILNRNSLDRINSRYRLRKDQCVSCTLNSGCVFFQKITS